MTSFLLPTVQHNKLFSCLLPVYKEGDETSIVVNHTLKHYLEIIKDQLNTRQAVWDKFKRYTNPYEYIHTVIPNTKQSVCSLKPLSRAFYKMIEIGHTMSLLKRLPSEACTTFHLAEGPGGFIEGLIHMRHNPADKHYGMTLLDESNSNIPGWRKSRNFLANNPNVFIETGCDGTGNLMHPNNLRHCYENYKGSMDLITADGGFDFSLNYSLQEKTSANLIFCQIAFALAMQKTGGDFLIKFFDTFSEISLHLLYLLSSFYDKVYFVKPNTSRYANSEKYVVCQGFCPRVKIEDVTKRLFQIMSQLQTAENPSVSLHKLFNFELPYLFVNRIEEYNAVLGQQQIENIDMTLSYMDTTNNKFEKLETMKKFHMGKCIAWCQKYGLPYYKNILTTNLFHSGVGLCLAKHPLATATVSNTAAFATTTTSAPANTAALALATDVDIS